MVVGLTSPAVIFVVAVVSAGVASAITVAAVVVAVVAVPHLHVLLAHDPLRLVVDRVAEVRVTLVIPADPEAAVDALSVGCGIVTVAVAIIAEVASRVAVAAADAYCHLHAAGMSELCIQLSLGRNRRCRH